MAKQKTLSERANSLADKIEAAAAAGLLPKPVATGPLFNLGKLPRNGLNEGTKHGQGGTAGTYAAVVRALQDNGPMTMDALRTLCKEQGDAGFARYAVRNHWLLPVEAK